MRKILFIFNFIALTFSPVFAQTKQSAEQVFELGEVKISDTGNKDSSQTLSYQRIEKFNRTDLSTALNLLPGVSIANVGPRNESVVYVRGFDLRQVPVFIDGVPVYVP